MTYIWSVPVFFVTLNLWFEKNNFISSVLLISPRKWRLFGTNAFSCIYACLCISLINVNIIGNIALVSNSIDFIEELDVIELSLENVFFCIYDFSLGWAIILYCNVSNFQWIIDTAYFTTLFWAIPCGCEFWIHFLLAIEL